MNETRAEIRRLCLAALARREHSQSELRAKCAAYATADVLAVLSELVGAGWQSDARFAEAVARGKAARGQGALKVAQFLRRKGVAQEVVHAALATVDWDEVAAMVYQRKFPTPPQSLPERAKRHRFLAARGFTTAQIQRAEKS